MPEQPPTLIHFHVDAKTGGRARCGTQGGGITDQPGLVTCFACRRTTMFQLAQQGVGAPTPLPQRQMPRLLKYITADCTELRDIIKQGLNADSGDAEREALAELADHFGLTYDDDTNKYT